MLSGRKTQGFVGFNQKGTRNGACPEFGMGGYNGWRGKRPVNLFQSFLNLVQCLVMQEPRILKPGASAMKGKGRAVGQGRWYGHGSEVGAG